MIIYLIHIHYHRCWYYRSLRPQKKGVNSDVALHQCAKLLHVVVLKRPLNLYMAENNSESVDVDPPPTPTQTHLERVPVAAVRSGWAWGVRGRVSFAVGLEVFEIEVQAVESPSK